MPHFKLTLEYDGARFAGWQSQRDRPDARSVQETLEAAIARVTGHTVRVEGSGRTDAGVHAEGQVASVSIDTDLAPEVLRRALGGVLPRDLAVIEVAVALPGFHARHDARSKRYRYRVWSGPTPSPLRRGRSHWVRTPLDLDAMRAAAAHLVGSHDFASFQAAGSDVRSTERSLERVDIGGESPGDVSFDFAGNGFLRHMVRNLVGTLLEVGTGRRDPDSLPALLAARDRALAGPTAPARGLCLVAVGYEDSASNSNP